MLTILALVSSVFLAFNLASGDHGGFRSFNCPSKSSETHECFQLMLYNFTITVAKWVPCDSLDDDYGDYGNDHHRGGHHGGHHGGHYGGRRKREGRGWGIGWGWSWDLCKVIVNESRLVYVCEENCCAGWEYDTDGFCTVAVDPDVLRCRHNETRFEENGQYHCNCTEKYEGTECERPVCKGGCLHSGHCEENVSGDHVCSCSTSFTGNHCEIPQCPGGCQNKGNCTINGLSAVCECPERWEGRSCEEYIEDKECPPKSGQRIFNCTEECRIDDDCDGHNLCCRDGCVKSCRPPISKTCKVRDKFYELGEVAVSDCQTCICQSCGRFHCNPMECPRLPCYDKVKPDNSCCEKCAIQDVPPDYTEPAFVSCPVEPIVIRVGHNTSTSVVSTKLKTVSYGDTQLDVHYSHRTFNHCACMNSYDNIYPLTAFSEVDSYGRYTECNMRVKVVDPYPPEVKSCPVDVLAFEGDTITWHLPSVTDNVGIANISMRAYQNNETVFDKGYYVMVYDIYDYDANHVSCDFIVKVYSIDTPRHKLPPQLRRRLASTSRINSFMAPVTAAIVVVVIGVIIVLVVKAKKSHKKRAREVEESAEAGTSENQPDAFENDIYAICGPPTPRKKPKHHHHYENDVKLPEYSPASDPPAYDDLPEECKKNYAGEMESQDPTAGGDQEPLYENTGQDEGNDNPAYVNQTELNKKPTE